MIFTDKITVSVTEVLGNDQYVIGAMKTLTGVPAADASDRGRIRYLMEHRHGTPFEHNCIMLVVHAPIFVWREWHRHRIGFSYNEESARYKKLDPVFYIPSAERPMLKTGDDWKPGRPKFEKITPGRGDYHATDTHMRQSYAASYRTYESLLTIGLDPGLARDVLPVGIYSTCWVTCNLRSALAFISLRTHDPAAKYVSYPLYEIEQGARQLEDAIKKHFPLCYEAFNDFGRVGP